MCLFLYFKFYAKKNLIIFAFILNEYSYLLIWYLIKKLIQNEKQQ